MLYGQFPAELVALAEDEAGALAELTFHQRLGAALRRMGAKVGPMRLLCSLTGRFTLRALEQVTITEVAHDLTRDVEAPAPRV